MDILYGIKLAVAASIPLILGLTVREVVKSWTAKKLGDKYTLKSYNPINYIDKVGTIILPLIVILLTQSLLLFGWCKPANINMNNIKAKKDRIIVYLSGSIANLLMIIFWSFITIICIILEAIPVLSTLPLWDMLILMANAGIKLNTIFIVFSLFPLLPYDGGKIVEEFLPKNMAINFRKLEPYALYIMLFIVFFTPIMRIFFTYMDILIESIILLPLIGLLN